MSDRIKNQIKKPKQHELSAYEFDFLNSIDTLRRSFNHYTELLESQYLKVVATQKFGYPPEKDLEFKLDLKSEDHLVTISEIPKSPKT